MAAAKTSQGNHGWIIVGLDDQGEPTSFRRELIDFEIDEEFDDITPQVINLTDLDPETGRARRVEPEEDEFHTEQHREDEQDEDDEDDQSVTDADSTEQLIFIGIEDEEDEPEDFFLSQEAAEDEANRINALSRQTRTDMSLLGLAVVGYYIQTPDR